MESQSESQIQRAALPFAIESAGVDDEGRFRVSGIMNTFKVTHSRRILHPRGFKNWLKRTRGKTALPMLGNHGIDVGGFASIGLWDRFDFVEGRGMRWSGWVGEGTPLADQARTLLQQRILQQLSVGWVPLQQRYIRKDDSDLDQHFKDAMDEAGVDEVLAFIDWYPVEGSVVDVADDPGARVAARAGQAEVQQLKADVAGLRAEVDRLSAGAGLLDTAALLAGLRQYSTEFVENLQDSVLELLASDETIQAAARDLREQANDLAALWHDENGSGDGDAGGVRARLDKIKAQLGRTR